VTTPPSSAEPPAVPAAPPAAADPSTQPDPAAPPSGVAQPDPIDPPAPAAPAEVVPPTASPSLSPPAWWFESEALVPMSDDGPGSNGTSPGGDGPGQGPGPGPGDAALAPDAVQALADGLVRRVPGAHLAPALRRDDGAEPAPAPALAAPRDRDQVRSRLSNFQANQRAGRAAADPPPDHSPQEPR